MRNVWLLLRVFAARWKNRQNIGYVIVLIIAMISTFCYVKEQETSEAETGKIVLGVAKEDTSEYAELLLQYFNENEEFLKYVELIEDREEALCRIMEEGEMDAYLVIPENFAQSMIQMENLPIRATVSMKNPTKALVMRHVMEAYETYIEAVEVNCTALYRRMQEEGFTSKELSRANVEISLELIFTALGKDDLFRKREVETEAADTLSITEHYRYTAVYFILLFLFIPAGLRMIDLRQNGLLKRLNAVTVSSGSIFVAVAIPYLLFTVGLLGILCIVEGEADRAPAALLLILPWLVVFLVLGFVCGNSRQYLFICSMVLVCLAVLGGGLIPETFLPDSFQKIAEWMPNRNFTYVMGGVQP